MEANATRPPPAAPQKRDLARRHLRAEHVTRRQLAHAIALRAELRRSLARLRRAQTRRQVARLAMLAKRYERKCEPDNGQTHPSRRGILSRAQSRPPPIAHAQAQSGTPQTAPKPVGARPRAPEPPP